MASFALNQRPVARSCASCSGDCRTRWSKAARQRAVARRASSASTSGFEPLNLDGTMSTTSSVRWMRACGSAARREGAPAASTRTAAPPAVSVHVVATRGPSVRSKSKSVSAAAMEPPGLSMIRSTVSWLGSCPASSSCAVAEATSASSRRPRRKINSHQHSGSRELRCADSLGRPPC